MKEGVARGRIDTVHTAHTPEAMRRAPRVDRHGGEVYVYRRPGRPASLRHARSSAARWPAATCTGARPASRSTARPVRPPAAVPSVEVLREPGEQLLVRADRVRLVEVVRQHDRARLDRLAHVLDDLLDVRRRRRLLGRGPSRAGRPPSRARSSRRRRRPGPAGRRSCRRAPGRTGSPRPAPRPGSPGWSGAGRPRSRRACPCRWSGCGPRCGCTGCARPATICRTISGCFSTCSPTRQKVAFTWYSASIARIFGVCTGSGPSSKVSATVSVPVVRSDWNGPSPAGTAMIVRGAAGLAAGRRGGRRAWPAADPFRRGFGRCGRLGRRSAGGSASRLSGRLGGDRRLARRVHRADRVVALRGRDHHQGQADRDQRGEQDLLPGLADQQPGLDRQRARRAAGAGDRRPVAVGAGPLPDRAGRRAHGDVERVRRFGVPAARGLVPAGGGWPRAPAGAVRRRDGPVVCVRAGAVMSPECSWAACRAARISASAAWKSASARRRRPARVSPARRSPDQIAVTAGVGGASASDSGRRCRAARRPRRRVPRSSAAWRGRRPATIWSDGCDGIRHAYRVIIWDAIPRS